MIDPADMTDVLDVLRADHGLVGTQRRAPRAAVCADIYTRCVNTQTTIADVVAAGYPWCRDFTGQLASLFRAYVAHKRRHALVDFDDLLLLWRAALADPAAGPALRGLFDAVLVDEYQDVNAVQAEIVRLLRPDGRGLTCVGDDAQAIYAFRGADPEHLRALARRVPGPGRGPPGPQLPVQGIGAAAGQRGPAAVRGPGARAGRRARHRARPRSWCAATTRPRRRARSPPGCSRRTRPAGRCRTRPCWSGPRTTATCSKSSCPPAGSRS